MNNILNGLSAAKNVEYADYVREFERKNKVNIHKLQTGDPDFSTPKPIIESLHLSITKNNTHYVSSQGLLGLREEISKKISTFNKFPSDVTNILITSGAVHGIYLTIMGLVNPGDKVLIFEPYWMPYHSILQLAGAQIVKVQLDLPQMNEDIIFDHFCRQYTNDIKLIITNSPNNPSGHVFSKIFYTNILNKISKKTYLLSDEVYEKIIFDQAEHISPASLGIKNEQIVSIYSFSKTYAMTGWRVGYLHAANPIITALLKLFQYTSTCVSPFLQEACITALNNTDVSVAVNKMIMTYSERRELLRDFQGAIYPKGAFYSLVKIPSKHRNIDFSKLSIELNKVAVSPGEAFGDLKDYYRISFAVDSKIWLEAVNQLKLNL